MKKTRRNEQKILTMEKFQSVSYNINSFILQHTHVLYQMHNFINSSPNYATLIRFAWGNFRM